MKPYKSYKNHRSYNETNSETLCLKSFIIGTIKTDANMILI